MGKIIGIDVFGTSGPAKELFNHYGFTAENVANKAKLAIENNFDASSLVRFIGMVLFLGSDAVLAKVYFCKGQNTRVNVVINHALYYLAQFALATSLFLF